MADSVVDLTIAGLTLRLRGLPMRESLFPFDAPYRPFITFPNGHKSHDDDRLELHWHDGDLPDLTKAEVVFDPETSWSAVRWQGQLALLQHDPRAGRRPYQITLLDSEWRHGDLYLRPDLLSQLGHRYNPLSYPLDEVLTINLLARRRGVLFHACGVDDDGKGLLFVGISGAGKSTTARVWQNLSGVTLLSDDRIIVRRQGKEFWAYGTPWPGEMGHVSAHAVPLKHVFLLDHGPENRLRRPVPSKSVAQMMRCVFPTYWDCAGMDFTLDFLVALVSTVPCHRLHFVPDRSVVDFVRQVLY